MANRVLVTGATGNIGGYAVRHLLKMNVSVRALVHQFDERSAELISLGVEVVKGDLLNLNSISSVMQGITSAFFIYPIREAGIIEATAYFAQAALENGVGAIVNLSQFGAHRNVRSHGAQNHWIAERVFDRSGLPVTYLRPTLFAEWFIYQASIIKSESKFYLPFGDASFAPITTEDIGRVVAAVLVEPAPHVGKSYELFGPEILNMTQVAELFSSVLRRPITYVPTDTETFVDIVRKSMTASSYFLQHISSIGQDLKEGREAGMNDLVETLTGQKPIHMSDFIDKHRSPFRRPKHT